MTKNEHRDEGMNEHRWYVFFCSTEGEMTQLKLDFLTQ